MPIFQCPECELRFTSASELDAHRRDDHNLGAEDDTQEGSAIPGWQKRQVERDRPEKK